MKQFQTCDDGAVFELSPDCFLNELIGLVIDIGGGFIHDEYFTASEYGARQADQLALTDGEVGSTLGEFELEAFAVVDARQSVLQMNFL